MKKLALLPTLFLAAIAAVFPTQAAELVKADTVDTKALAEQAKQLVSIEMKALHVKIDTKASINLAKSRLDKEAKANDASLAKNNNYAVNFAE